MSVEATEREQPTMTTTRGHRRLDVVVLAVLLAVAIVLGYSSWEEGLGTVGETGTGFFPFIASLALLLSSLVALAEVFRDRSEVSASVPEDESGLLLDPSPPKGDLVTPELLRLVGVVACALLMPLFAEIFGFVTTLTVSVVGMAKIAGLRGWWRPVATGLIVGGLVWGLFVTWLHIPLPLGQFGLG